MHVKTEEVFIWTEVIGCGEIVKPCIESFLKHHNYKLHVIGYKEDLSGFSFPENVLSIVLDSTDSKSCFSLIGTSEKEIRQAYQSGHNGTATLWASLIASRKEQFFIHLDADTIFLGDVISPILYRLRQGYNVVGTRRPYRYRSSGATSLTRVKHFFQRDAVNTHCFGFSKAPLPKSIDRLRTLINGDSGNRIKNRFCPVIDFFDRLSFILSKRDGVYYLDSKNQRRSGFYTRDGDFEKSMISFTAVGSGYSFFHGNSRTTSPSYREFALSSYALFSRTFLGKEIGIEPLRDKELEHLLSKLDTSEWKLKK